MSSVLEAPRGVLREVPGHREQTEHERKARGAHVFAREGRRGQRRVRQPEVGAPMVREKETIRVALRAQSEEVGEARQRARHRGRLRGLGTEVLAPVEVHVDPLERLQDAVEEAPLDGWLGGLEAEDVDAQLRLVPEAGAQPRV